MNIVEDNGDKSVFAGLALVVAIAMVDWWTASWPAMTVVYVLPVLLVARGATRGSALWMAGLGSGLSMLALFRTTGLSAMWASIGELVPIFLVLWAAATLAPPRREDNFDRSAVASDVEAQVLRRTKDLVRANSDLEARRAESVSLLAALIKSSDDAIIGMSRAGTVQSWNVGAERIYGYAPHEIVGHPITDLCPPDRLGEVPTMLNRIAKGEYVRNMETIQRRNGGRQFNVPLTISPVKDGDGTIAAASAIARDITQTASAAHRPSQGSRELEEAQDLSGPAQHIINLCAWCKRVPESSGEWYDLDTYITERSGLQFNGGLCPECMDRCFAPAPEYLPSGSWH